MIKIKKLEYYLEMEKEDFDINESKIDEALNKLPSLHSKWINFFYNERILFLKFEEESKRVWKEKHEYYLTSYNFEIKHNQVHYYIESDEEYQTIIRKVNIQKEIVSLLERIVKRIDSSQWIIKNMIDWKKFNMGV